MSGHSKWSKVKHQKAVSDAAKGAAFTKVSRGITVAVREGGGITDPDDNFRLRLALEKAHGVNMPKDTIDRAIAKAKGMGSEAIEQVLYEGYGPGGVAFIVEAATDNRNRMVSAVKNTFERFDGTLTAPGAVSFLFSRRGMLVVLKGSLSADQVLAAAIAAGAQDIQEISDAFEVFCDPAGLFAVKQKLEEQGIVIEHTELIMHPNTTITVTGSTHERLGDLMDALEALDDVQQVYTNASG